MLAALLQKHPPPKRTEDLLEAIFAVLALRGVDSLRTTDKSFHGHFGSALKVLQNAGGEIGKLASNFYKDIVSNTYDELDHALIVAEGDGFVKILNPRFARLQISIAPKVAEQILGEWKEQRAVFEEAAARLHESTIE